MHPALVQVSGFSAHADWRETLEWMDGFEAPPKQTFMVHGEPAALKALADRVAARGWSTYVPRHLEQIELARPT